MFCGGMSVVRVGVYGWRGLRCCFISMVGWGLILMWKVFMLIVFE